ncbi:MAG: response regulator [Thermoanaerobaculia bacterium]
MHILNISLLGEFALTDRYGDAVSVPNRRTQAFIIYLALRIDRGGSVSEATELLRGDRVHEIISDLRFALRALPSETVVLEGDSVRLNPALVSVDAQRFESLGERNALGSARAAVDLYRGNLLAGYESGYEALDEWLAERRSHYWQLALWLHARLLGLQIRAGWWERAADMASRLLSLDPSQEVVHRTLMRLQLEQGRPDAALRRYHECADILRREFNRLPGPETERVHLEIAAALEKTPAPREVQHIDADSPVLILVVEDDAVSSTLVEGFLTEAGFEVVTAADGGDALIEIGRHRFDLLIFDVNLPTLGGLELFEVMIRKGYETPAIFITGLPGVEAEMKSLEMGAADFLRKPLKKEVLLPRIRNILQRRNRSQAGGPRASE